METCAFSIIKRRLASLFAKDSGTVMYEYVLMSLILFFLLAGGAAAVNTVSYWDRSEQNEYGMLLLGFGAQLKSYYGSITNSIAESEPGNSD